MKITRRGFLQAVTSLIAMAAVPKAVAINPGEINRVTAQITDGLRESIYRRYDLPGSPWMVYYAFGSIEQGVAYDYAALTDEEPTPLTIMKHRNTAAMAIERALKKDGL